MIIRVRDSLIEIHPSVATKVFEMLLRCTRLRTAPREGSASVLALSRRGSSSCWWAHRSGERGCRPR